VTVPHITDQFEAQHFNRYKDSPMMTLKKCRNMQRIVYLSCLRINTC